MWCKCIELDQRVRGPQSKYLRRWQKVVGLFCALLLTMFLAAEVRAATYKSMIRIQYELPKNAEHRPIYDKLKQAHALELIARLLSPLRLPRPLLLKVSGCDGVSNAWYYEGVVTVCYEYLVEDILQKLPKQRLPSGVTPEDALLGPLLDVFLHETGHAVFDLLKVPVYGREEDAADRFSTYMLLQLPKEDAHRLILGSAYQYRSDVQKPQVSLPTTKFSNEHGVPAQRFYDLLCIAYGSDQKVFADVVDKGFLPKERAEGCDSEYEQAAYAFKILIGPHFEKKLAKKSLKKWTRDVNARPKYPLNRAD